MVRATEPSRVNVSAVRFTPGDSHRLALAHRQPDAAHTDGLGLHQTRGGAVEGIRAGDVLVTPADVWHRHGATVDHYMSHLSITESPGDGRPDAQWGDHLTDEEYTAP